MVDFLFGDGAALFTACAIFGTTFFLIRMIMLVTVGDLFGDGGVDGDVGVDFGDAGSDFGDGDASDPTLDEAIDHAETASLLKFISIQGIVAFIMGVGWGGFAGLRGLEFNFPMSMMFGVAFGFGLMWFLAYVMGKVTKLNTSGNIGKSLFVGSVGEVTIAIPEHDAGTGQVRMVHDGRMRFLNARSKGGAIASKTRVKVTGLTGDGAVQVETIS
ncbi:MAG: NfeD family protein [Planctomycetota bacterium]